MLFAGAEIIKEKRQKPLGKFNTELYMRDCNNGVDINEVINRCAHGHYNTPVEIIESKPENKYPDKVKNMENYQMFIDEVGFEEAERFRKAGLFLH